MTGHIVSSHGLCPDREKVKAINNMPNPTNSKGVQRLIGSLDYLRGFIPRVSETAGPLRLLLKDNANWTWGPIKKVS